jgi:AraC family transcriptional regulator
MDLTEHRMITQRLGRICWQCPVWLLVVSVDPLVWCQKWGKINGNTVVKWGYRCNGAPTHRIITSPGVVVDDVIEQAVGRVIGFMHQNLGEQFTIDDMARTAMYSKFHFSRAFQRVTGVSPGRFLSAIRLQEAKRLLMCTSLSVTDISHRVGYTSVGTFSSRFRSSVGLSPSTYRQVGGFTAEAPRGLRGSDTRTATVRGELRALPGMPPGVIFVGLFPDRIPQGAPVRCVKLDRPGPYVLTHVPPGSWHLLAHSVAVGNEPACGGSAFADDRAPYVASHGPITVRAGVPAGQLTLTLRPIGALDPPVLLAMQDVRAADVMEEDAAS